MKSPIPLLSLLLLLAPLASAQEKPIARIYYIPSGAMEPTLNIKDRIWATPAPYEKGAPKRGDIAIMGLSTDQVSPWTKEKNRRVDMLKRVVAGPGDRIKIVRRVLYLNEKIQKEPFVKWEQRYSYDMKVVDGRVYSREYDQQGQVGLWTRLGELVPEAQQAAISRAKTQALPANQYLVLGDNRSNSNDSHIFGLVKRSTFIAKVTLRIYPNPRIF